MDDEPAHADVDGIWTPMPDPAAAAAAAATGRAASDGARGGRRPRSSGGGAVGLANAHAVDAIAVLRFDAAALGLPGFVALDAGDAVVVVERFCRAGKPLWFRGYVFSSAHSAPLAANKYSLGVFPASHVVLSNKKSKLVVSATSVANASGRAPVGQKSGSVQNISVTVATANSDVPAADGEPNNHFNNLWKLTVFSVGVSVLSVSTPAPTHRIPAPSYPKYDTVFGSREPLVDDLSATLVEWAGLLKKHLAAQDYNLYNTIINLSQRLYKGRNQLLASALSRERLIKVRNQLVDIMEFGNHIQGLEIVIRHRSRGFLLGEKSSSSIVRVFRSHFESYERLRLSEKSISAFTKLHDKISMDRFTLSLNPLTTSPDATYINANANASIEELTKSATQMFLKSVELPHSLQSTRKRNEAVQTYYVHFELSACFAQICLAGEHADLAFSLYDKNKQKAVSEDFVVRIDYNGMPVSMDMDNRLRLKTVFCEVSDPDSALDGEETGLCLVVRIVRVGRMNASDREERGGGIPEYRFSSKRASNESMKQTPFPLSNRRSSSSESLLGKPSISKRNSSAESVVSISDSLGLRRPFAVGVLDMGGIWNNARKLGFADTNAVLESSVAAANVSESEVDRSLMEGAEYTIQLHTPISESSFPGLPDQILKQQETSSSHENIKVILNMSAHTCSVTEPVPVSLAKVGYTQRLGFPERIHPHDARNSVYITLHSGEFVPRTTTFAQRNVQVVVQVRTTDGVFIENCISRGFSAMESTYESVVYYHSNTPNWSETIRIDLEPQMLEQAHVFILFRQCTSAQDKGERGLFAFAFLPFVRGDYTVLKDEVHNLCLYKYDKNMVHAADYLKWSAATEMSKSAPQLRDKMTIRTSLCSTLMTQSTGVLNLLHWHHAILHFKVPVAFVITQFRNTVPSLEIVKFLHGILDALVEILDSPTTEPEIELSEVVFDAMIYVFGIIIQPRFAAYEAALEAYVDKFLRSTSCWRKILAVFVKLLEGHTKIQLLCDSIRVWGFWAQVVVRSGLMDQKLARNATVGSNVKREKSFSDSLSKMVESLSAFMAIPFDDVTEAQILMLRHFMELLPYLERVYGVFALTPMLIGFVDSVNTKKPILNTYKLALVHSLIRSPVFNDQKSRLMLVNATKRWILEYISFDLFRDLDSSKISTFRLSLSITAELIEKLHRIGDRLAKEVVRAGKAGTSGTDLGVRNDLLKACIDEISPLLDHFIRLFGTLAKLVKGTNFDRSNSEKAKMHVLQTPFRTELAELSSVILSFVQFLPSHDLLALLKIDLESYSAVTKGSGIGGLYIVMQNLLRGEVFPDNWASANMMISKVGIKLLRVVNDHLKLHHSSLNGTLSAQVQLFLLDYFSIILQLLNSRAIATEYFKPQQSRLAHRLDADVRGEAGELFRFAWKDVVMADDVDKGSMTFIRSLFGPFLELTMSPHPRLKYAAIELLFSIIELECKTKGDFNSLEAECIDRLEGLIVVDGKGDQVFRRFFVDALGKYFTAAAVSSAVAASGKSDEDSGRRPTSSSTASINTNMAAISSFAANGTRFLKSVDTVMDICITLRDIPSDARFNDERIWMTLKLMYFFRDMGRRGLYVRYIHKLSDLHSSLGNTAESALALKLHGDLLPWSHDEQLDPLPQYGFPHGSSSFERREQIWLSCLNGLELTSNWERAIVLYCELGAQYEKKWFNYGNYARILRKQADLIENIMNKERYFPTYYRVGFYGRGHLSYLQGKQFIYKGREWEKLASFCESILNKFVGSQLLRSNAPPTDEIINGKGSWIQITSVNPEIDRQRWADGDINSAWYNWEYDSERFSEIATSTRIGDGIDSVNDGVDSALVSLSGISHRKSVALTPENTNYIKCLIEPDLDPDTESSISKATVVLDSIPAPVRAYYSSNEINAFSYSRPFRRAQEDSVSILSTTTADPAKDLIDLWTEKTLFLTTDTFPCLSQRSQVIKSFTIQLSPIENAIIAMKTKTRQLHGFLKQFEQAESVESQNINTFSLALNGAIDAPINGGIPMYRRAFLSETAGPYPTQHVKMLSSSIQSQIEVLHRCLAVHGRLIGPQMRPLHDSLVSVFYKNFEKEIGKLDLPTIVSLAPHSIHQSSASVIDEKATLRRTPSSAFISRKTAEAVPPPTPQSVNGGSLSYGTVINTFPGSLSSASSSMMEPTPLTAPLSPMNLALMNPSVSEQHSAISSTARKQSMGSKLRGLFKAPK
ncbi:hypothetical protein BDR26DRAFT_897992 [Obelidium mucronatum]|nr:hypothetical protein BDR26DRAFT_897992 [Obelidium mucronatum]